MTKGFINLFIPHVGNLNLIGNLKYVTHIFLRKRYEIKKHNRTNTICYIKKLNFFRHESNHTRNLNICLTSAAADGIRIVYLCICAPLSGAVISEHQAAQCKQSFPHDTNAAPAAAVAQEAYSRNVKPQLERIANSRKFYRKLQKVKMRNIKLQ